MMTMETRNFNVSTCCAITVGLSILTIIIGSLIIWNIYTVEGDVDQLFVYLLIVAATLIITVIIVLLGCCYCAFALKQTPIVKEPSNHDINTCNNKSEEIKKTKTMPIKQKQNEFTPYSVPATLEPYSKIINNKLHELLALTNDEINIDLQQYTDKPYLLLKIQTKVPADLSTEFQDDNDNTDDSDKLYEPSPSEQYSTPTDSNQNTVSNILLGEMQLNNDDDDEEQKNNDDHDDVIDTIIQNLPLPQSYID